MENETKAILLFSGALGTISGLFAAGLLAYSYYDTYNTTKVALINNMAQAKSEKKQEKAELPQQDEYKTVSLAEYKSALCVNIQKVCASNITKEGILAAQEESILALEKKLPPQMDAWTKEQQETMRYAIQTAKDIYEGKISPIEYVNTLEKEVSDMKVMQEQSTMPPFIKRNEKVLHAYQQNGYTR